MLKLTEAEIRESMFGLYTLMVCMACEDKSEHPMEGDAHNYTCPMCDAEKWCAAEELMVRGEVEVV